MSGFARFWWHTHGGQLAAYAAVALILSTVNWTSGEKLDLVLELALGALGLFLAHQVFLQTSREFAEYVRALPLPRRRAAFLPYASYALALVVLAALVQAYEWSGLAHDVCRLWARLVRSPEWPGPHRRPLAPLWGFFGWPLAGYATTLLVLEELRRRFDPGAVMRLARSYALLAALGVLFPLASTWLARRIGPLPLPNQFLLAGPRVGLAFLVLGLLACWRVRALVVDVETESYPSGGEAWDS